jgi:hypothetical protein
MSEFAQMHIFFAVTTAAVILLTALMGGVLVALFRLFRTLDRIASEVHEEAEQIREDLADMRAGVKKGFRFVPFLTFFGKTATRAAKKKK